MAQGHGDVSDGVVDGRGGRGRGVRRRRGRLQPGRERVVGGGGGGQQASGRDGHDGRGVCSLRKDRRGHINGCSVVVLRVRRGHVVRDRWAQQRRHRCRVEVARRGGANARDGDQAVKTPATKRKNQNSHDRYFSHLSMGFANRYVSIYSVDLPDLFAERIHY